MKNNRVVKVKTILWFIVGIAFTVIAFRLFKGLGAATNLTDNTPWGIWIGFDVLSGVALAAGGFVVCAVVYIFHLEKYRGLARPAVLTAFLGYIAVAVGLIFDLGLPWRIWHPAIYWQPHSALFEVAMCVMLYLTVLLLEFSPVVLEKIPYRPFPAILKFLKKFTIVFVLLGIMLSTLHQSSLGTLFMLMPSRLHPLWYSSIQSWLFLISAISLGLAMVTTESSFTSWLYKRKPETNILSGLARAIPIVLGIYVLLRIGEIANNGNLGYIFDGTWESILFIVEILFSAIVPALLLSIPKIRKNTYGLPAAALMVVIGFVMHRIDVGIISSFQTTGTAYIPSFMEITTTLGIVSGAVLVFLFFVENFTVYHPEEKEAEEKLSVTDVISDGGIFNAGLGNERRFSLFFIIGAALTIFILPANVIWGVHPESTPVKPSRILAVDSLKMKNLNIVKNQNPLNQDYSDNILLIDGNQNKKSVLFDHDVHVQRQGGKTSCNKCHHMNLPAARATECSQCHSDMYVGNDIFDHDYHAKVEGGNEGCIKCHTDPSKHKNRTTSKQCAECHKSMTVENSFVSIKENWSGIAAGYMQAMHGLCLNCHEKKEKEAGIKHRTGISTCSTCHAEKDIKQFVKSIPVGLEKEN